MTDAAFDAFIAAAWDEHAEQPQQVADRLAASLDRVQLAEQVRPFAGLVSHVYGEHLGQWQAGISLLQALRDTQGFDESPALDEAIERSIKVLRFAGGESAVLDALPDVDRAFVLASAAAVFTGRSDFDRATQAYAQALDAAVDLPAAAPAIRALAVAGNNLAAALEEKADATPGELQAMVTAAQGGLTYWKLAGTWLQEERAEYRLARSLLKAGQAQDAIASAQRCVAVCERNAAPPFEVFFGEAVLALAHRAAGDGDAFVQHRDRAHAALSQVPEDERRWCERELRELG